MQYFTTKCDHKMGVNSQINPSVVSDHFALRLSAHLMFIVTHILHKWTAGGPKVSRFTSGILWVLNVYKCPEIQAHEKVR